MYATWVVWSRGLALNITLSTAAEWCKRAENDWCVCLGRLKYACNVYSVSTTTKTAVIQISYYTKTNQEIWRPSRFINAVGITNKGFLLKQLPTFFHDELCHAREHQGHAKLYVGKNFGNKRLFSCQLAITWFFEYLLVEYFEERWKINPIGAGAVILW